MKQRYYNVACGAEGRYGMQSPVTRERAQRLISMYAVRCYKWAYGFCFELAQCPKEVKYALNHGASPVYRVLIG